MNKIHKILNNLGLTTQESRVYLALLKLQEARTGMLCKFTDIASSNIYNVLDGLVRKGLVAYRVQNNIKVFMPSPPESLGDLFLEKQQRLDQQRIEVTNLIQNLKHQEVEEEPISNYKYFEGIPGIKSMWHEINSLLTPKSEERIFGGKKEAYRLLVGFYDEHHRIRNKLKAKANILISPDDQELGKKRQNKNTKVRYADLKNLAEWGVVDDKLYIQHIVTKKPHAFLITDKIFARTFEQVFDQLWKHARK